MSTSNASRTAHSLAVKMGVKKVMRPANVAPKTVMQQAAVVVS